MKMLYFKALLPVSVDIEHIWNSIPCKEFTHLGGESSKYSIVYEGEIHEGLKVLEMILEQADEHDVSLKTFERLEGEDVQEEKVEEAVRQAPSDCL